MTKYQMILCSKSYFYDMMILGSKGHAFHACMKMHDFGTRKT